MTEKIFTKKLKTKLLKEVLKIPGNEHYDKIEVELMQQSDRLKLIVNRTKKYC